ncbi:MAG: major capsid protein [Phycisphaerae bacterium]|nr:major capsid protein [Phycisphaerae bacterium]
MPSPSASLATLRPDLGGSLEQFDLAMDAQGFIGLKVMPVLDVAVQAGTFGKIPLAEILKNRDTLRAPGAAYSRSSWTFQEDSFATVEHGAEEPVDDREAAMYAAFFDAEQIAAVRARDVVMRNFEKRIAALLFNASTFPPTTVTNGWDDAVNATPIADVEAACQAMWDATGLWPNALIVNRKVFRNLRLCDEVTDKVKAIMSVLPGDINEQHLRAAFDLPFILVGGSAKNTAAEGATAAIDPIWSDEYAAVARIATGRDIREPCIGRTLHWAADGSRIGAVIESYRDESVRSDIIRARFDTAEKLLYAGMLQLLDNITT